MSQTQSYFARCAQNGWFGPVCVKSAHSADSKSQTVQERINRLHRLHYEQKLLLQIESNWEQEQEKNFPAQGEFDYYPYVHVIRDVQKLYSEKSEADDKFKSSPNDNQILESTTSRRKSLSAFGIASEKEDKTRVMLDHISPLELRERYLCTEFCEAGRLGDFVEKSRFLLQNKNITGSSSL